MSDFEIRDLTNIDEFRQVVGLEKAITPNGDVSLVGPYHPTTYAFDGEVKGMKPSDMAGWETPIPKQQKP